MASIKTGAKAGVSAGLAGVLAMFFVACGDDASKVYNTWNLVSLSNNGANIDISKTQKEAFVTIDKEKFNGNAGCNSFFGSHKIINNQIQSSNTGMMRMLCDPESMAVEDTLIKLFSDSAVDFRLENDSLVLQKKGDEGSEGIKAVFKEKDKGVK
ncbi:hypothetical protein BKN38_02800 [Helicobacter sp. CLO-3]|nr:hypothetical protein BA723_02285 [Helicobacter sp. CLO-3]OHU84567.1 hypothetical protein BKN38_02800 [Helicobacter sp. CLO-3]